MYDVVGDVHGQARELEALLDKLGYECEEGCYSHQNRKVIFLGDFIDRGNHQREVINIRQRRPVTSPVNWTPDNFL